MKQKNSLYPYPVLGAGRPDYVISSFNSNINTRIEFNCFVVDVEFSLNDDVLIKRIADGSAAYVVKVECSNTAFREKYQTNDLHCEIRIDLNNIKSLVTVYTYVVALKDIHDYQNPNFNNMYNGIKININKANILAEGYGKRIYLDDNDFEYKDSDSLFRVQKITDNVQWIDVSYHHDDYVLIRMSEEFYNKYLMLSRGRYKETIFSIIMLPVLVALLNTMAYDNEEHEGKKWFNIIVEKLRKNGIDLDDLKNPNDKKSALVVSQKIFMNPIMKAMNEIISFSDDD